MTLVEILVVLVVVAVASGASMLAVGAATRDRTAESAAQRLVHALDLAVDEATMSDSPIMLTWTEDGYGFASADAAMPLPARLATAQMLRAPLRLAVQGVTVDRLAITSAAAGPAVTFRIEGTADAQLVTFDGFTAAYVGKAPP